MDEHPVRSVATRKAGVGTAANDRGNNNNERLAVLIPLEMLCRTRKSARVGSIDLIPRSMTRSPSRYSIVRAENRAPPYRSCPFPHLDIDARETFLVHTTPKVATGWVMPGPERSPSLALAV